MTKRSSSYTVKFASLKAMDSTIDRLFERAGEFDIDDITNEQVRLLKVAMKIDNARKSRRLDVELDAKEGKIYLRSSRESFIDATRLKDLRRALQDVERFRGA